MSILDFSDREPPITGPGPAEADILASNAAFYARLQGATRKRGLARYGWIALPIAAIATIGIVAATSMPHDTAEDVVGAPGKAGVAAASPPVTAKMAGAPATAAPTRPDPAAAPAPKALAEEAPPPAPNPVRRLAQGSAHKADVRPAAVRPPETVPLPAVTPIVPPAATAAPSAIVAPAPSAATPPASSAPASSAQAPAPTSPAPADAAPIP